MVYVIGVPVPTNDPSVDVGTMQSNCTAIDTWTATDHLAISASATGQHKQITFASNNPPAVPTTPPILFTSIQDGNGNTLSGSHSRVIFLFRVECTSPIAI